MSGGGPLIDDEAAWLRQHADVLFETNLEQRLTALNEPDPEAAAPRVFVARGRSSSLLCFRVDAPPQLVSHLRRLSESLSSWDGTRPDRATFAPLRDALQEVVGDLADESHGCAFRFPPGERRTVPGHALLVDETTAHLLDAHFPYTRSVLAWRSPVVGIVLAGAVVSACYSARRRRNACEAGVYTVDAYRGRGFAAAVVGAWARAAEAAGMKPLYSTSWDNAASRRVAAKLGLDAYADTLSLT